MAEPSLGASSSAGAIAVVQDEDRDFDPSAEMLVHDFDDEQTLEEEEKLEGETNCNNEIDDLTREGEMPIEELLKMYGYGAGGSSEAEDEDDSSENPCSKEEEEEKREVSDQEDEDEQLSADEPPACSVSRRAAQLLCSRPSNYFEGYEEESEDEDYIPLEDWKKEIMVGSLYQAETPVGLCEYKDNEKVYENEDQLLWNPELVPEEKVVEYLTEASKRCGEEEPAQAVPEGSHIKDNEQALHELFKCNFDAEEALRRYEDNLKTAKEELLISEEQYVAFEKGHKDCEEGLCSIGGNKIHLGKRKYSLHPGTLDYLESAQDQKESSNCNGASTSKDKQPLEAEMSLKVLGDHSSEASQINGSSMCPDLSINTPPHSDASSPGAGVMEITLRREEQEDHSTPALKKLKTDSDLNTETVKLPTSILEIQSSD